MTVLDVTVLDVPVLDVPVLVGAGAGWTVREAALKVVAVAFGAWGLGLLPGEDGPQNVGIVPVETWLLAGLIYSALAAVVARMPNAAVVLGFSRRLRPSTSEGATPR